MRPSMTTVLKAGPLAITLFLASLLAGCGGGGSDPAPSYTSGTPLTGNFGGTLSGLSATPASLALTAVGGQVTLPCGQSVEINGPLTPDASGKVSAAGSEPLSGGPARPVGAPAVIPVSVSGGIVSQTLTLTITAETGTALGTYVLVRDKAAPPFTGDCPG